MNSLTTALVALAAMQFASASEAQSRKPDGIIVDQFHPLMDDQVGYEVIEHGEFVIAAALADSEPGSCVPGYIHVYSRTADGIEPVQRLSPSRPTVCNLWRYGLSMAVIDRFLFVGCPEADTPEWASGLVEVHEKTPDGYELVQTIFGVPGQGETALFGTSMTVKDQELWVSMPGSDLAGLNTGAVARFAFQGGEWVHQETVTGPTHPQSFAFQDVAFDGERMIASDRVAYAVVLERNASGAWEEIQSLVVSSRDSVVSLQAGDGWFMSGDGNASSAPFGTPGRVIAYRWTGTEYVLEQFITPSLPTITPNQFFDRFGYDVHLHEGRALIGAPYTYYGGVATEGAAYVFELQNGAWVETERIERPISTAPAGEWEGFDFGYSVYIGDDVDIIGMPFYYHADTYAGGAFIYERAIGEAFCEGTANSTGAPATLEFRGSRFVSANDLDATANHLPPGTFAVTVVARGTGSTQLPGTGPSLLCVDTQTLARLPVRQADAAGEATWSLDPAALPAPAGPVVAPGETIIAQTWYRDTPQGPTAANLTNALSLPMR